MDCKLFFQTSINYNSTMLKKHFLVAFLLTNIFIGYSQIKIPKINPIEIIYKQIDTITLKLHVYQPENLDTSISHPAIVFFHGGGWNGGTYKAFSRQASYLASKGMIAFSVDYRLFKTHGTSPFEAVNDAKSAMRYIRQHAKQLHINPDMIAAGGGSAGGHLAAACGNVVGLEEPNEDLSISSVPNALVLYNPVYDNSKNGYGYGKMEGRHLEISPLHNISVGAPPTVVFFGTKDKTTPVASSEEYKKRMDAVGSRCDLFLYEGQEHSFFNRGEYFTTTLLESEIFLKSLGYL